MADGCAFNLIDDPVFHIEAVTGERRWLSLPEVFAAIAEGEKLEFTGLQAHQMHAWHAFMCQLAAIALHRARSCRMDCFEPAAWRDLILALTEGRAEPWCLVVENLARPAFLQPPVPEGSLAGFKKETSHPDMLDLLVTSRNHDVKCGRVRQPRPEHWVYGLVSGQTMEGFAGKNNYGIVRMNGGYGNRAGISAAAADDWSIRFRRDTAVLLETRENTAQAFGYPTKNGLALQWLAPWDGNSSLRLDECDPFFIEICRRIRLSQAPTLIAAKYTGTAKRRVDCGETKGNVGDPWMPIKREDSACYTAKDLSYAKLQEVLFGADFQPSAASIVRPEDGQTPVLLAKVLVGGQGGTEGYHDRTIPCRSTARRLLGSVDGRQQLGALAKQRVELVATVRNSVLRPAILALIQGAPANLNLKDKRADPLARKLDLKVDGKFFVALFDDIDRDPGEAMHDWIETILAFAREILDEAIASTPIPTVRRYRAISAADTIFYRAARKKFPDNFPPNKKETNEDYGPSQ